MDLTVLYKISYGMYILGTCENGQPSGCIINTFTQVTSENPIVAVCLNKNNYTYEVLRRTGRFSLSILSEETKRNAIAVFGFASGRDMNKFAHVQYTMEDGLPMVQENCCGWLTCNVLSMADMETHVLVTARLTGTRHGGAKKPMTYDYYYHVIKGRASKNAPTYQAPQQIQTEKSRYVCDVCGYILEGDLEALPEDYVCPVCGVPKAHFQKQTAAAVG